MAYFIGGPVAVVGAQCGSAGGAMFDPEVLDPARRPIPPIPRCFLMFNPPVIIDNSVMGIMRGFQQVNIAFNTWGGTRTSIPIATGLAGNIKV